MAPDNLKQMKRKLLQQINNLAKFTFTDSAFNNFMLRIRIKDYHACRIILDSYLNIIENKLEFDSDNENLLEECKNIDKLLDLVIELIIVNDREKCGSKQIRSYTE